MSALVPAHDFMFGGPDETEETVERTLVLIDRLRGPVAAMLRIRLYPGTLALRARYRRGSKHIRSGSISTPVLRLPHAEPGVAAQPAPEVRGGPSLLHTGRGSNELEPELVERMRRRGRKGEMWEYMPI